MILGKKIDNLKKEILEKDNTIKNLNEQLEKNIIPEENPDNNIQEPENNIPEVKQEDLPEEEKKQDDNENPRNDEINESLDIDPNVLESNIYPVSKYNDEKSSLKSIANDLGQKYSELNINKIKLNKHNIHNSSSLQHLLRNENYRIVHLNENLVVYKNTINPLVLGVILYDYYLNNPQNNYKTGEKALFYFLSWNNIFKNKYKNDNYLKSLEDITKLINYLHIKNNRSDAKILMWEYKELYSLPPVELKKKYNIYFEDKKNKRLLTTPEK